jgi:uncharacterized protein (TIGR00251 family)
MTDDPRPSWLQPVPGGVQVRIKAVPGASRSQVAGPLGDRLKVRIAAPPEDGRANAALCELIAGLCKVPRRAVTVVAGHAHTEKTLRIDGIEAAAAARLTAT